MISLCRIDFLVSQKEARRGFTLVELLVSITVGALLLAVLVTVISRALQVSQRSADAMTAYSSAATAIDLVATDLASLSVNRQPFEYLQARPESAPFEGIQPMRLMLLLDSPADSAQPSPSGSNTYPDSGQTHAVSYLLAWQNPVSSTVASNINNSVFGFYRQVVNTPNTFQYVLGTPDLYTALYMGANAPLQTPPALSSFVAGNVVDFQVAIYACPISTGGRRSTTPAGLLTLPAVIINPVGGATASQPYQRVQVWGTQVSVNNTQTIPAPLAGYGPATYAEVSLTVIEDAGAKLWGNGQSTNASSPTNPTNLRQKYGHTLTRKVLLRTPE